MKKSLQELADETKDCPQCKAKLKLLVDYDNKLEQLYKIAIRYQDNRKGCSGRAFTEYKCIRCDEDKMHSNTMVPVVCPTCVREIEKNFSWEKL